MSFQKWQRARRRIIRRCRKIIGECRQCVIDGEFWNSINPQCEPLDLEYFRVQAHLAERVLQKAEAGEPIDDELYARWEASCSDSTT